jgi:hypothetical protein
VSARLKTQKQDLCFTQATGVLPRIDQSRVEAVKQAVVDQGYRGKNEVNGTAIMLSTKALERDNHYQHDKKRYRIGCLDTKVSSDINEGSSVNKRVVVSIFNLMDL